MYHDIVSKDELISGFQNESAFQYKVEESLFEEHVKALVNMNVSFTFDDGGVSFYTKAAPILEKYDKKGIFFISTKYLNTPGFLTSNQVKDLFDRGHIIGSHSHSHPENISLLDEAEIYKEWFESITILREIIKGECVVASIPNGYKSKSVCNIALKAGLKTLYTSTPTTKFYKQRNMTIKGRYVVLNSMTTEDVMKIVSKKGYRRWLLARWSILKILKKMLGSSYNSFKSKVVNR